MIGTMIGTIIARPSNMAASSKALFVFLLTLGLFMEGVLATNPRFSSVDESAQAKLLVFRTARQFWTYDRFGRPSAEFAPESEYILALPNGTIFQISPESVPSDWAANYLPWEIQSIEAWYGLDFKRRKSVQVQVKHIPMTNETIKTGKHLRLPEFVASAASIPVFRQINFDASSKIEKCRDYVIAALGSFHQLTRGIKMGWLKNASPKTHRQG